MSRTGFLSVPGSNGVSNGGAVTADDRISRNGSQRSLRSGNSNYNSMPNTKEKLEAAVKLADSIASSRNVSGSGTTGNVNSSLAVPATVAASTGSGAGGVTAVPGHATDYRGPLRGGFKGTQLPPRVPTSSEVAI